MLYYPYPNNQGTSVGGAAVCSLFSDSATRFGQLSISEKAVVRDLLTFSRCPSKPIPLFKMSTEPVAITLSPNLVNKTQTPAVKALLKVVNPNRDKIFHEWETSVSLMPGEEKELLMSFQLPAFYSYQDTGICHVLYSIFDAEGNLLVMDAESEGGRFAVYQDIPEYVPPGDYQAWITSPGEIFDVNEIVPLTIYYKNNRENPLTICQWWQWEHTGGESLPSLTLAPGEEKQYIIDVTFPQYMSNYKEIRAFFHLHHKLNTETSHRYTQKGLLVKGIRTVSRLNFNSDRQLTPGGPFNYSIQSKYVSTPLQGNTTIKLALEKYSRASNQYEEIKILKEEEYDFNANGDFQFAGIYTPETVHPYGRYRLKLEVTAPNGIKEQERVQEFMYGRSGFLVSLEKMPQSRLVPGESYTIPIKITNFGSTNNYTVKNGTYVLVLRSENNHEVFRKEITGITIAAGEEQNLQETFVFNPVETGQYTLEYNYRDETGGDDVYHREAQPFFYITSVGVTADKAVYEYMDTANIGVTINGVGSYTVQLSCPEAGFSETRTVNIPTGSPGTIEQFQLPIGVYSIYTVNVEVKDVSNRSFNNIARLSVNPIELDCTGQFKDNIARAGKALEFEVNLKRISGFSQPLVGELAVTAAQLNYQDIKTVNLQPLGDNRFIYTIPVDPETPVGFYGVDVKLNSNGVNLVSKQHNIYLPAAKLTVSKPGSAYNAGDSMPFTLDNVGGKTGTFGVEILLKDAMGKTLEQMQETKILDPTANSSITFSIPENLKSGTYMLVQKTQETITQTNDENAYPLQITGLSASLYSYTLKEKYFDYEVVSGKSEISPGNGDIANGSLLAEIIKIEDNKGIEKIYPWVNCITLDSQKRLWVGTESGVSRYDGTSWQAYTQLPDSTPMGMVLDITAGPGDKIYALTFDGIVVIADNGAQVSKIPFYSSYHYWHLDVLAVDKFSRIWMIYVYQSDFLIYYAVYYDETGWHIYQAEDLEIEAKTIHCDGSGGVWLISPHSLTHIKSDLSWELWDENSGVPIDDIFFSYVDVNGVVWLNSESTGKLYSFDRSAMLWTDYSVKPGYPLGMFAVRGDESGNIYGIGITENYLFSVYRLQNGEFITGAVEFDTWTMGELPELAVVDGNVYINGSWGSPGGEGEGNEEFISGLLKISATSGTGPQTVWSRDYAIEASAGATLTLDLSPGTTFDPGVYILKTRLYSSLEQLLAGSSDTFMVRDSDVSISLFANCSPDGFVKTGTLLPVTVEVLNNTQETKSNLEYLVKKLSPTGEEEVILSQTLTLSPGQLETVSITFSETTSGTWKIGAGLSDNSNTEPVVLSSSELVIGVADPLVTMEILAPEYAGDENFDVKVRLINEGNIDAQLNVKVLAGSETPIDETLTLQPLEERILTIDDAISADKTYTIALGGDIEQTEIKTVKYGYVENFSIDIRTAYREGPVSIGYTLANSGGLSFTDQVHFELFTVGGTLPIYTVDRTYHLYPDQAPIMDTINIPLLPGNYRLQYHTSKHPQLQTALLAVQPSGIGAIAINPLNQYPIGAVDISYSITNTDTVPGYIPVTITLIEENNPGNPIDLVNPGYYLLPGETQNDVLHYEFTTAGNYTLNFTGAKLPAPVNSIIRVMNLEQVTANLSIGQVETGSIPVNVTLDNDGYQSFTGTVVIEVEGLRHEEIMEVSPGSSFEGTVGLNTAVLTPGI
jgi:hypothetical protein